MAGENIKNRVITAFLWVVAIAATAYLTKGESQGAQFTTIILVVLAATNIFLIKEIK